MGQLAEFAVNHTYLVLGVLASLVGVVFYELRLQSQGASQVSTSDAVRLINKGATVIDVRNAESYGGGHIVNARNVELSAIESDQSIVKKQKNKVLLTVCDNGYQSGKAASLLRKSGHENVFSLKAGLGGWRGDNLPLVK
jgi:rhodanese-related sulfurtransferase